MLKDAGGHDGVFLVRSKGSAYVLSLCAFSQCEHHVVKKVSGFFELNKKPTTLPCSSLPELIAHLTKEQDGITAKLTKHVPPAGLEF